MHLQTTQSPLLSNAESNRSCPHQIRLNDLKTIPQFLSRANAKVVAERLLITAKIGDILGPADAVDVAEKLGFG
jgi:hypothetical protein